jgi:hypothetical protein
MHVDHITDLLSAPAPPPLSTPSPNPYTAWDSNCTDEVVGFSPWFGVQGESKPLRLQNHTLEWQLYGPITKVNMYYSWNFGCLQGVKATYGYKARNARIIGHEKKLYSEHIKLGGFENINRVDVRQVRVVA